MPSPIEQIANSPTIGQDIPLTTLSGNGGSISSGATSMKVAGAAPAALQGGQFRVIVDQEIILVTGGQSGTTWTISRGQENTGAATHNDGVSVWHKPTAGMFDARYQRKTGGVFATPEQYGAVGDGIVFNDGAIQAGSTTFTSAAITSDVAASLNTANTAGTPKHIYVPWAGAGTSLGTTSSGLSTGGAITSIPRTSGAAVAAGPIIISSGAHAQLFHVTAAGAAVNAAIPVASQTPNFAYPSGSALSQANAGLKTTITSASTGSATLANAATQTVDSCCTGWFGTDDAAAFQSAMAALETTGGVLQCAASMYILDGSLTRTLSQTNAVVALPITSWGIPVEIRGTAALGGGGLGTTLSGTMFNTTVFATTRINDVYSATYGPPSLIGAATIEGSTVDFGPYVTLTDFSVLLPDDPAIGAIDLSRCGNVRVRNVTVRTAGGTDGGPYGGTGQKNTHIYQFGMLLPIASNGGNIMVERFAAHNCYLGLLTTEHAAIHSAIVFNCVGGVAVQKDGIQGHAGVASYMDIEGCVIGLAGWTATDGIVSPTQTHFLNMFLDFEDQGTYQWATYKNIEDQNNVLYGRVTAFRWYAGASADFLDILGCSNLLIEMLHSQGQPKVVTFNSSNFSWAIPFGVQNLRITAIGGGGQGGGGGSASTGIANAGGSGGGAGATTEGLFAIGNNANLSVAIGAGGSAAGGGATAGGNAGTAGSDGGNTSVVGDGTGISLQALGGGGGAGGVANANTGKAGGAMGGHGQAVANTTTSSIQIPVGGGGASYTGLSNGQGGAPYGYSGGGGGGGGSSSATLGGTGGSTGAFGQSGGAPGSLGGSGTTSGTAGGNAAANTGAGGGGGGGGTNNTGAGGAGGNGGSGYVIVELIY